MKIAFGYKMGVGKDTACKFMHDNYGGQVISFAEPIYMILNYAQDVCSFPREKDRQFLQYIGSEWARKKDPNVWVNYLLNRGKRVGNVYVSDVRYKNEFYALKADGFVLVKILRDNQEDRTGTGSTTHSSEVELDSVPDNQWDYIVDNNGSIEDFYSSLRRVYENSSSLECIFKIREHYYKNNSENNN